MVLEAVNLLELINKNYQGAQDEGTVFHQLGDCHFFLGNYSIAVEYYRKAIKFESTSNINFNGPILFAEWVVGLKLTDYYAEVLKYLETLDPGSLLFPADKFTYFALCSLIKEFQGETEIARKMAKTAMVEAEKKESGLSYHKTLGIVHSDNQFLKKVYKLAQ